MPTFRDEATAASGAGGANLDVVVPPLAQVNDRAIVVYVFGGAGQTHTLTNWGSPIIAGDDAARLLTIQVWTKLLVAADLGSTVTVSSSNPNAAKRVACMVVYSDALPGASAYLFEPTDNVTAHNSPAVQVNRNSSVVVNFIADRGSPPSSSFTTPSAPVVRSERYQGAAAGGGAVSLAVFDTTVAAGTRGAYTFTGQVATDRAVAGTVALQTSAVAQSLLRSDRVYLSDSVLVDASGAWQWSKEVVIG